MEMNEDAMADACILHVINEAEGNLTLEEICERIKSMTVEERLDALCRYKESDPNP
jgi:hypothetical protein